MASSHLCSSFPFDALRALLRRGPLPSALAAILLCVACTQPAPGEPPATQVATREQVMAAMQLPMCERAVAIFRLHAETYRAMGMDPDELVANVTRLRVRGEDGKLSLICPVVDMALVEDAIGKVEE